MHNDAPRLNGHSAPWNRRPAPTPEAAPAPAGARAARRWPWVVAAALIVGAVGWLVWDAALS